MASDDKRHLDARFPVARFEFEQGVWASGASGALAKTLANINGTIRAVEVTVNDNTGNRTATVTITTANGATVFTKSGIAENASTFYVAESHKAVQDADFNPVPINTTLTATITPSGDPSTSGMTVDVKIYVR